MVHPAAGIRGKSSPHLNGKRIVLGVTGSIAAVETVRLARELIRQGADVVPVMSHEATRIVHPNALEYATGNRPVTDLTGQVEHLDLSGDKGSASLLLIAPCTANTIGKIARGLDDNAVTSCASAALGSGIPILVAPAMHDAMARNPLVQQNLRLLQDLKVGIIPPAVAEGAAKLADPETIVGHVLRALGPKSLAKRRVLVISGATAEAIDDMRWISNRSTGETGRALAVEAWRRGADVTLWTGVSHAPLPGFLSAGKTFESVADLRALAKGAGHYDVIAVPAAVSDFTTRPKTGKIRSGQPLRLDLQPTPKLLPMLRRRSGGLLIAFKAEPGGSDEELTARARELLRRERLGLVVANDLANLNKVRRSGAKSHTSGRRVVLVTKKDADAMTVGTSELASVVWDRASRLIRTRRTSHP